MKLLLLVTLLVAGCGSPPEHYFVVLAPGGPTIGPFQTAEECERVREPIRFSKTPCWRAR